MVKFYLCFFVLFTGTILSDETRHLLRKHFITFQDNLDTTIVADHLFSRMVITFAQREEINSCRTSHERAKCLLTHLLSRGSEKDVKVFIDVLRRTDQNHLARLLVTTEPRVMSQHTPAAAVAYTSQFHLPKIFDI